MRMLDFGAGFYTTSNKEQAIRWAQRISALRQEREQYISSYDFDVDGAEGSIDTVEAIKRFKVQELYDQILFHNEQALEFCLYMSNELINGEG